MARCGMQRGVRREVRELEKEALGRVALDEVDREVGEKVGRVSPHLDLLAVHAEDRVLIQRSHAEHGLHTVGDSTPFVPAGRRCRRRDDTRYKRAPIHEPRATRSAE